MSVTPTREEFLTNGLEYVSMPELLEFYNVADDVPDHQRTCVFCMTAYGQAEGDEAAEIAAQIKACGHYVGHRCIQNWDRGTCPWCRARLFKRGPEPDSSSEGEAETANVAAAVGVESSDESLSSDGAIGVDAAALRELQTAARLARTPYEHAAATDPGARRSALAYGLPHTFLPAPQRGQPDRRPYADIRAFEIVLERDVPALRAVLADAGYAYAREHEWVTVRPRAFLLGANSVVGALQRLGELPMAPWGADAQTRQFDEALLAVEGWVEEHAGRMLRFGEVHARIVERVGLSVRDVGPAVFERVSGVVALVLCWRLAREIEVFGQLC